MPIDLRKARDFVYSNGVLWERALFAYHFQDGSLEHLHRLSHWYPYVTIATLLALRRYGRLTETS